MRRSGTAAIFGATLLASACALLTATPPQVEVQAIELRGLGLLDQALGVALCVTNPNDAELDFRRVQVAVDVAGAPLAEGASETVGAPAGVVHGPTWWRPEVARLRRAYLLP